MKNKSILNEIGIAAVLLILAIACFNPLNLWMPSMGEKAAVIGLCIAFIVYATFLWREKAHDEREALHRSMAGRFAFLAGVGVLSVGIIWQWTMHQLDVWLLYALCTMVLAKIIGLIYGELKN